jgi:transcriptional regulator with XRE-family HTH domain
MVQALRARHGLSQAALAYRAGTTQQAISRIELGQVSPTVDMLARLAAACGEELVLDARPRGVPFDDAQLGEQARLGMSERLELASSWNRFAGEIRGTALKPLCGAAGQLKPLTLKRLRGAGLVCPLAPTGLIASGEIGQGRSSRPTAGP